MFVLLESSHEDFIEQLQQRLDRHGISSHIANLGQTPDGLTHFVLQLPLYSQMEAARYLLYRDNLFASSLDPDFHERLREVRNEPRQQLLHWMTWLTKPAALRMSGVLLLMVLLGSLIEHFWL